VIGDLSLHNTTFGRSEEEGRRGRGGKERHLALAISVATHEGIT